LICTQVAMAGLALTLRALVAAGLVTVVWMCLLAGLTGCAAAIDSPARQVIVLEMVGADLVQNAMALNSMVINLARMVGPSIAAAVIAVVGIPACFAANALSYIAMLSVLLMLRADELQIGPRVARAPRQLRDGVRYLVMHRALFVPFAMVTVAGVFAWEFRITLPLVARFTFGGGPDTLAILFASLGVGSLFGGLVVAAAPPSQLPALSRSGVVWGFAMLVSAFAPSIAVACAGLFVAGASSITFNTFARTMLQLGSSPEMRGRVMALWAAAWVGSSALGGPLVGLVGQTFGARSSLVVGGVPLLLAAVLFSPRRRMARA
jgi:MFS family permease